MAKNRKFFQVKKKNISKMKKKNFFFQKCFLGSKDSFPGTNSQILICAIEPDFQCKAVKCLNPKKTIKVEKK